MRPSLRARQPRAPRVTITHGTCSRARPVARSGGWPATTSSSPSLTISMSSCASSAAGSTCAGAALSATLTPAARAARACASTVSSGVSSCSSSHCTPSSGGRCIGCRAMLAPGATVMAFSASSDRQMKAVPVGSCASRTTCSRTPASPSEASIGLAKSSSPRASSMRVSAPPARAQATAWLAPLPPGKVRNWRPSTVSPGAGTCAARTTKSRLAEPATRTVELMGWPGRRGCRSGSKARPAAVGRRAGTAASGSPPVVPGGRW